MKIKDLKPNKSNPRKISIKKLSMLEKSMKKFGDLSGFVYNVRSKSLVSGHQKKKTLGINDVIKIEVKHDKPTEAFTIAEGFILVGDERFKYREVDAPLEWEIEAMIAANRQGGEWDNDILKLNFANNPNMDLDVIGFEIQELEMMDIEYNPTNIAGIGSMLDNDKDEETDLQYIRNEKKTEEGIDIERPPNNTKYEDKEKDLPGDVTDVFDDVNEETSIVGKRFIIIIDCKDGKHKKEIREKLQDQINDLGGKIF